MACLDTACAKLPVETELQKKVRLKEREDLETAVSDQVQSLGFAIGGFDAVWEALGVEVGGEEEFEEDFDDIPAARLADAAAGWPEPVATAVQGLARAGGRLLAPRGRGALGWSGCLGSGSR